MPQTTQTLASFGFATAMGVAREATFGTAVAPTQYIPFVTDSMTYSNKLIKRVNVRKIKGQTQSAQGQVELKGSFESEAEPDSIGLLLGLALGVDTVTPGVSGVYSHAMKLASPLNTFTLSTDYGKNSVHQFTGCKMESMDFSVKPGGFLMAKFSVIGQSDVILPSQSLSPVFGNVAPFEFEHLNGNASALINGVQYPLDSINVSLKNNLAAFYGSGSARLIRNINERDAMVSGTFTLPYESDVIANLVISASSVPLQLVFTHTQMIGATAVPYSFTINCPNIILESAVLDPKRGDNVMYNVKFAAFDSGVNQDDLNILLVNAVSTSYTA